MKLAKYEIHTNLDIWVKPTQDSDLRIKGSGFRILRIKGLGFTQFQHSKPLGVISMELHPMLSVVGHRMDYSYGDIK